MREGTKRNVLIAGSTGMVGSLVLKRCLEDPRIENVTTIDRRSSGIEHAKLTEIILENFENYTDVKEVFENIDAAYFCIGVYTGAVPKDVFRKITVDYARVFGESLKEGSPEATLCFLSGMGADRSEQSSVMFARDKGAAENILDNLQLGSFYAFRPSYIYPVTPRKEPNLMYRIMRLLYPLTSKFTSSITSEQLASVMHEVGMTGAAKNILENEDMLSLYTNLRAI